MKPFRISLTVSILSSLACLLVLTWLLLSLISFKTAEKDLLTQKNNEARVILAAFVEVTPAALDALPQSSMLTTFAARLAKESDFAGIYVVDGNGKAVYALADRAGFDRTLADTVKNGREAFAYSRDGRYLFRYAPIHSGDQVVGAARLTLSLAGEQERLRESRRLFLAYFVLDFLLLLGFGSFLLSRIIVVPIRKLLAATKRIASGDYHHNVHVPGSAEIAELAESFNAMAGVLERKRLEVEQTVNSLERTNKELQAAREETVRSEKMASVGLLAAGMAHEVGTPLAAIIGYAGFLKEELKEDDEKFDYVRRIEMESGRIDRIVRGLLDYARPSPVQCEAVDSAQLIRETVDLVCGQGILKHITLSLQLQEDMPAIYVDPHQLQQVLINLLINARDAMPGGGSLGIKTYPARQATFSATDSHRGFPVMGRRKGDFNRAFSQPLKDTWLAISVSDTGDGIAPEDLGRIFDPFFTTKEPGKGTGLGLAISARIIDSFAGRIVAESEPGKGTIITIWLPIAEEVAS